MGKIIGIDLGTTNSCVAIMRRWQRHSPPADSPPKTPAFA